MFYSHEVLTSQKYGVATIWLVATLGAKSNLKKINRKAILDVDISKACEIITTPEAPMALRLQSNLLYGVSRVYSQQCYYALTDAQLAQNNMKALLSMVRTSELDPNAGKARPEQLVVQDDPAFLPDFFFPTLDMDLSILESATQGSSLVSSAMSAQSHRSSHSSAEGGKSSVLGLSIPTSDTGNAGGVGEFMFAGSDDGSAYRSSRPAALLNDDEGFLPDVGFNFDEEGNIIDSRAQPQLPVNLNDVDLPISHSIPRAQGDSQMRQEYQDSQLAEQRHLDRLRQIDNNLLDFEVHKYNDILPEAEPFPQMKSPVINRSGFLRPSSEVSEEDSSSSAEAARIRKRRVSKLLPVDLVQELRNADLINWTKNYVINMTELSHQKTQRKLPMRAKKNAVHWVFGLGIGSVGIMLGASQQRSPLDMFAGDKLFGALTGFETHAVGRKRSRSDEDVATGEERRTRLRSDEYDQTGRRDDSLPPLFDDDTTIERGRDALPLIEDFSASMPWNITASIRGSRQGSASQGRGFASSIGGFPSSAGGLSSAVPAAPSSILGTFNRTSRRLTSASPLAGRGRQQSASLEFATHDDNEDLLGGPLGSDDPAFDEFELGDPTAAVDLQTVDQVQWVKAALDQESSNFMEFLKAELYNQPDHAGSNVEVELAEDTQKRITFAQLLPPAQHSKLVAAQAFLHVLTLATKGLLQIKQDVGRGPIYIGFTA